MAKRQRHTPEQVIAKLREAEAKLAKGTAIAQACKDLATLPHRSPQVAAMIQRRTSRAPGRRSWSRSGSATSFL